MSKGSKNEHVIPFSHLSDSRKKSEKLTFFKSSIDIDDLKNKKELDQFRRSRRSFLRFVFTILVIHNAITIVLVVTAVVFALYSSVNLSLNVIIPAYFVNVTVQVFALMRAVVRYFDKSDFIGR